MLCQLTVITRYGFVPSNLKKHRKVAPTSAEINSKLQIVFLVADRYTLVDLTQYYIYQKACSLLKNEIAMFKQIVLNLNTNTNKNRHNNMWHEMKLLKFLLIWYYQTNSNRQKKLKREMSRNLCSFPSALTVLLQLKLIKRKIFQIGKHRKSQMLSKEKIGCITTLIYVLKMRTEHF